MEDRHLYGASIDLQPGSPLPTAAQLAALAGRNGEFAVALRGCTAYGLRMVPSALPVQRHAPIHAAHASIVSGGTKASCTARIS